MNTGYKEKYLSMTARKIREELKGYRKKDGTLEVLDMHIENIARKILDDYKLYTYPVGIYQIADNLGFHVYEGNFKNDSTLCLTSIDKDYVIEYKYRWDKIIGLREDHDKRLQRYLTARSIAYYLLDYNGEEHYHNYCSIYGSNDETERRALLLANSILMPRSLFRAQWRIYERDNLDIYTRFQKMSRIFEVPAWAIQKRYKEVFEREIFEEFAEEALGLEFYEEERKLL